MHRSSPLALYIRRVRMQFLQLTFDESDKWWTTVHAWLSGAWVEPDWRTPKDKAADRSVACRLLTYVPARGDVWPAIGS